MIYGKRLFAGTISIYFAFFEKYLHFGPKLPYIKSGFSKKIRWLSETRVKDESPAPLMQSPIPSTLLLQLHHPPIYSDGQPHSTLNMEREGGVIYRIETVQGSLLTTYSVASKPKTT